jgi:cell volume regulation protein A
VLAAALALFGIAGRLHCSGYLAVYVAGLYAGNRRMRETLALRRFQDGMTWLAQIAMFVVFGLFATPERVPADRPGRHRPGAVSHLRGATRGHLAFALAVPV